MDFVYVCREGENEELRYSIRSVVKNAPVDNIWVIGGKPDWYTGNFISVKNDSGKFNNIKNCIKVASETDEISEDFVLMNDDFFITEKLNRVSLYYGGVLTNRHTRHQELCGPNAYATLLSKTDAALKKSGIDQPLNYDVHVPMVINKTKMRSIIHKPYAMMSYYGNLFCSDGINIEDVKIYSTYRLLSASSTINNGTPYFSTEDGSFNKMQHEIKEIFPEPSIYEYPYSESN